VNQNPAKKLPHQHSPESTSSDLQRYLRILRKRVWVMGAVVALVVTGVVLYTLRQPKVYRATASVVIDPAPPQVFGSKVQEVVQLGAQNYWSNQEYYNTQVDILEGYELAEATVVANRLWENPSLLPPQANDTRTQDEKVRAAAVAFHSALNASQNPESRVVRIGVRHTDPELAIKLANKHVESYLAFTRSLRSEGSGKVAQFLAAELDKAQQRLKVSEDALLKFKEGNGLLSVSIEDKQSILARDIQRYTDALSDTRVKRIELSSLRARIKALDKENLIESPIFTLSAASAATTIGLLKDAYTREKQRMLELSEDLGPKHPAYIAQKQKVDDLYKSLEGEARLILHDLDERHSAFLANEAQFVAELERLKKEAFELAPKTVEYSRLARQQQSDESNYNLVLERLRASELTRDNQEINVRPHEIARGATQVSPRMRLNVVIGVMLALLLAVGLALLLEYLDRTVKSAEDIEAAVGAPFLGVIPVVEEVSNATTEEAMRDRDLFVFKNPTSRAAECCRSIRTNILFSSADRRMRTLTISSPRPREGKTTTTIYLGTTMAQSGQKVLLIDTDLRRPRLHKSLGISRQRGLTNLILGDATVEDVVKTTDIPNLYVLPCGPQPPNPAELLLTARFQEVLKELEDKYERILLDSPPLLAVTDAVVLARISDGVVLIAQAGKTATDDVRQAARSLHDVDAPVLGVILNDMDLSDRRYGYYYYQYGYGENLGQGPETEPTH
jgi:capsular exopolysaccharide synthesis family protein